MSNLVEVLRDADENPAAVTSWRDLVMSAADRIETLERELAEAQRDAERYRFLRGKSMLGGNQFYSRIMEIHDEEIDKARGA